MTLPPKVTPRQLGFSPDGKQLICRDDQSLRVWDADLRQEIKLWKSPDGRKNLYGFSADGNLVAGGSGNDLYVLNLQTNARLILQGVQRRPYWVSFSPDGKFLTMRDDDDAGPRVWDLSTGKVLWRLPKGIPSHGYSACFSPDGKVLAVSGGKDVGLWDPHTGKSLKTLAGFGNVNAISPDGRWLATGTAGHTVKVCNLETGKAVETGEGHFSAIEKLAFLPHFDRIATAQDSGAVRLWDPVTGTHQGLIKLDVDWIRGLAISPDGRQVAAGRPWPR